MDVEREVQEAYQAWDAAFNKGSAERLASFYAEDAIFLPATHDVIKGPRGVSECVQGLFGMGVTGHKLEIIESHAAGNLFYAAARWSANGKDADGKDQPWGGIATHIFERQPDASLKLKLHTFN